METACFSETFVPVYQTAQRHIEESRHLDSSLPGYPWWTENEKHGDKNLLAGFRTRYPSKVH
jgi:hypothetical protein